MEDSVGIERAEGLAELLAARHYAYATFARLFGCEPDQALIDALQGDLFAQAWAVVLDAAGPAAARARGDLAALAQAAGDVSREEFTRLFIGPGELVSPPWESVHRTGSRSLFQEATLEVRKAYAAHGFRVHDVGRVADDHVSTELSFMSALCLEAMTVAERAGAVLADQAAFLQDHLLRWVGKFACALAGDPRSGAYALAARALDGFLTADAEALRACAEYSVA